MTVQVDRDGPVTIITIDRPERRNAVDAATASQLYEAFRSFAADDSASAAVLTGAGGTFCSGADLRAIAGGEPNLVTAPRRITDTLAPMGPTRLQLDKPVIAAIEGHAVAGGLELAVWCHLRVMAGDAILGVFCRRWGVPLIDGGTVRLPRLIGHSRALDLILTGREVAADEALAIGLVNRVAEPGRALADALALAHELAGFPQQCLREDLASAQQQWDLTADAALFREVSGGRAVLESGEALAGAERYVAEARGARGDRAAD